MVQSGDHQAQLPEAANGGGKAAGGGVLADHFVQRHVRCAADAGAASCRTKIPKEYRELISVFYTGLAALQVGDDVRAESKLGQVTQIAAGRAGGLGELGNTGAATAEF